MRDDRTDQETSSGGIDTGAESEARDQPTALLDSAREALAVLVADLGENRERDALWHLARLLFALSAEGRVETPRRRGDADREGLRELAADAADGNADERRLTRRVAAAFDRLDSGDGDVPAFPGGLFAVGVDDGADHGTGSDAALEVGDSALAAAVSLLARRETADGPRPFDYGALDTAALEGVYEQLLRRERAAGADSGQTDSGRTERGAYYTPASVAEYVVDATLDPVVADLETASADPETVERRVLDLSVLDPAMGTGRFLTAVEDRLTAAILRARDDPDDRERRRVRRAVAANCVYGVDRDPLAVELARGVRWLAGLAAGESVASVADHLVAGDALVGATGVEGEADGDGEGEGGRRRATADVGVAREEAVHWPLSFPEVAASGGRNGTGEGEGEGKRPTDFGFDAVVGNPPYIRSRSLPDDRQAYYRDTYATATGSFDAYVPFLERMGELGRRVGAIVPNKWTTTEYGRPLRDRLLDDWRLTDLVDVSARGVFPDADVYPVVVVFETEPPPSDHEIRIRRVADGERLGGGERETEGEGSGERETEGEAVSVSRSFVDRLGGRVVPVSLDAEFAPLARRALRAGSRLGDHVDLAEGIHTGNVREKLVVAERVDETCRPLLDGKSVGRYRVDWSGKWIRYDESRIDDDAGEYADLRATEQFHPVEKLLIRDISDRPVAAYDDAGHYALNTLYTAHSAPDSELSLGYLLGVFNSAFVRRYVRQVYGGTHVAGEYLRFKPMFARAIPIPDPADADADPAGVLASCGVSVRSEETDSEAVVAELARRLQDRREELAAVEPDPLAFFGRGGAGDRLGSRATAVPGADTVLAATARERDGQRVGRVEARRDGERVVLAATARYKPADGTADTDGWGFAETEPVPALAFDAVEPTATLVAAFVPAAVAEGGVADFRERATRTISALDRLRDLRLPADDDVRARAAQYRAARQRAAALRATVERLDDCVDRLVAALYGFAGDERALGRASEH